MSEHADFVLGSTQSYPSDSVASTVKEVARILRSKTEYRLFLTHKHDHLLIELTKKEFSDAGH